MATLDGRLREKLSRGGGWLTVSALLAVVVFIFIRAVPYGYSSSPDVAHHYALIRWLHDHWGVESGAAPVLGEMAIYPRYAHVLAACVSALVHSPFIGMQVVATMSLVACWAAVGALSRLLPGKSSWLFVGSLLALLAVNRVYPRLDLFGHEIVVNYFLPQLAGQAFFMLVVAGCAFVERARGSSFSLPLIAVLLAILAAGIHLLPALEGVAYGLMLLGMYAISDPGKAWKRLGVLVIVTILAGVAIYRHPAFMAMRTISDNNGYLPLSFLTSLPRLATMATIVALMSATLLYVSLPYSRLHASKIAVAARHVGCAGGAIAALCLMQLVASRFGIGSEYACRKYAFGLSTFLLLQISLLIVIIRSGRNAASHTTQRPLLGWLQPAIILAAMWVLTFSHSHREVTAPEFLAVESAASVARATGAVDGTMHAYARGLVVGDMSNVANYLVSLAIFSSPRDGNGYAPLYDHDFPEPSRVGAIFSSTDHPSVWSDPSCIRTRLGDGFVVSDGQCIMAKFSDICRQTLDFSSSGHLPETMMTGVSSAGDTGRWTDGNHATLRCRYPSQGMAFPHSLRLSVSPFSPSGHSQHLTISVNGVPVGTWSLTTATLIDIDVPESARSTSDTFTLSLDLPDALSPRNAGISSDSRNLGVMLDKLEFH